MLSGVVAFYRCIFQWFIMGERRVFVGGKRVDSFRHDSRDAESDAYQR